MIIPILLSSPSLCPCPFLVLFLTNPHYFVLYKYIQRTTVIKIIMAALHVMKETFCALITFFSLEMYSLYTDEWIVSLFDNVAGYKAKKALTCLRFQQADISLPDRGPPVLCCTPMCTVTSPPPPSVLSCTPSTVCQMQP